MPMDRPRSTIGLATHLLRVRWQQLSARGRMLASVAIAFAAVLTFAGLRMALGGCCAGGCPVESARLETEATQVAAVSDAEGATGEEADGHEGCASAH